MEQTAQEANLSNGQTLVIDRIEEGPKHAVSLWNAGGNSQWIRSFDSLEEAQIEFDRWRYL